MCENKVFLNLKKWGCDVDGAMERFLEDEELYLSCLEMVLLDSNFEKLEIALKEEKIEAAFDAAHTLKGVFANLGLTPMLCLAEQMVEPLRRGVSENLWEQYEALLSTREQLKGILEITIE